MSDYIDALRTERAHVVATTNNPDRLAAIDAEIARVAPPEPAGGGVPDGNIKAVTAWVGDDLVRAAAALEVELAKEKPRSSLVEVLTELTTKEDPDASTDPADTADNGQADDETPAGDGGQEAPVDDGAPPAGDQVTPEA